MIIIERGSIIFYALRLKRNISYKSVTDIIDCKQEILHSHPSALMERRFQYPGRQVSQRRPCVKRLQMQRPATRPWLGSVGLSHSPSCSEPAGSQSHSKQNRCVFLKSVTGSKEVTFSRAQLTISYWIAWKYIRLCLYFLKYKNAKKRGKSQQF